MNMNRNLIAYFHLCLSIFLKYPQKIKYFTVQTPIPDLSLSAEELEWLNAHRLWPLTYYLHQQIYPQMLLNPQSQESLDLCYWQQQKRQLQLTLLFNQIYLGSCAKPILIKGGQSGISLWKFSGVRSYCDYDFLIDEGDLHALEQHWQTLSKITYRIIKDPVSQKPMVATVSQADLLIEFHINLMPSYLPNLSQSNIQTQQIDFNKYQLESDMVSDGVFDIFKQVLIPTEIDQLVIYVANQSKNGFYAFDFQDVLEGVLLIHQLIQFNITVIQCHQRLDGFKLLPSYHLCLSQIKELLLCIAQSKHDFYEIQQWIDQSLSLRKYRYHHQLLSKNLRSKLYQHQMPIPPRIFKLLIWDRFYQILYAYLIIYLRKSLIIHRK
jgi:hypothetical protein